MNAGNHCWHEFSNHESVEKAKIHNPTVVTCYPLPTKGSGSAKLPTRTKSDEEDITDWEDEETEEWNYEF